MLHHHVQALATFWFFVGYALHALVQVNDAAQRQKKSIRAVFQEWWISILVRGFISLALFIGFLNGQIDDLINGLGITLPTWADKLLGLNISQGWLAALIGYSFDSALSYIPRLQKIGVPPAPPAEGATDTKGTT